MSFKEEIAVLRKVKKLVQKGWCRTSYAKDKNGKEIDHLDKKACSWCAAGAINRACVNLKSDRVAWSNVNAELIKLLPLDEWEDHLTITKWNDIQPSKIAVLKMFDKVIASFKEKDKNERYFI